MNDFDDVIAKYRALWSCETPTFTDNGAIIDIQRFCRAYHTLIRQQRLAVAEALFGRRTAEKHAWSAGVGFGYLMGCLHSLPRYAICLAQKIDPALRMDARLKRAFDKGVCSSIRSAEDAPRGFVTVIGPGPKQRSAIAARKIFRDYRKTLEEVV